MERDIIILFFSLPYQSVLLKFPENMHFFSYLTFLDTYWLPFSGNLFL